MVLDMMRSIIDQLMGLLILLLQKYYWIAEATYVVRLPFLDAKIQPLADNLGMQLPLIKYTLALFLVYPFAFLLRKIPGTNAKHLLSMLGGISLVQWVFAEDWIHSFISSLGTYIICMLVPGKSKASIAFVFVMGYMCLSHIYRMYVSYMTGIFDFTGTQMVLTMKLTSFAYNLADGTADRHNVFPSKPHEDKRKAKIYADRSYFAIESLPNPLEFFGYVFCFTCIMAGPAFEYNDYIRSINGKAFERPDSTKPKLPSATLAGLQRLLVGVLCLVGHLASSGKYPMNRIYDATFIASNGHLARYWYTYVALFAERLKYYFAWKIAEGASIMGGFGFQGFDKKTGEAIGWSGVENIHILGFELASNTQSLSRAWNKRTQGWLERYTYLRSGKSLVTTYFISAIWHGLYPGFFIFFMTIPLLTEIERLSRSKINPLVIPGFNGFDMKTYPPGLLGNLYWVFCCFMTTLVMNFMVQVFPIQSWDRCIAVLGGYHYAPFIFLFSVFIVLRILPTPKIADKKTA